MKNTNFAIRLRIAKDLISLVHRSAVRLQWTREESRVIYRLIPVGEAVDYQVICRDSAGKLVLIGRIPAKPEILVRHLNRGWTMRIS